MEDSDSQPSCLSPGSRPQGKFSGGLWCCSVDSLQLGRCSIPCSGSPYYVPCPRPHPCDCPSALAPCLPGTLVLEGIRSGEWLPSLVMPRSGFLSPSCQGWGPPGTFHLLAGVPISKALESLVSSGHVEAPAMCGQWNMCLTRWDRPRPGPDTLRGLLDICCLQEYGVGR